MIPAFDYIAILENIVEKIRLRGLITSIIETTAGRYLLTLSDYEGVEVGKYVTLGVSGLEMVKILSIPSAGEMIVKGDAGIDVSLVTKYIRLDPFFYADKRMKTIEALLLKNNSYFSDKKFPSVELVLDYNEFDDPDSGVSTWNSFKCILCESSDPNDTAEEKNDKVFTTVLRPNYAALRSELKRDKDILTKDAKFTRTEHYSEIYKTGGGHDKGFFVDAIVIEATGLKLRMNIGNCNHKDF